MLNSKLVLLNSNQKNILILALPIIAGQLSQMIVSITDAIMVGRLGYVPLAAASLMISIYSVPSFACLGFSYLISSLVAEKRGQNKIEECASILYNAATVTI
ncbi:MAG: MATE family efflux transporter, partial [Saprospiraceae bacterium]